MASLIARSRLVVEGKDDEHAIRHLLVRYGIDCDETPAATTLADVKSCLGGAAC